MSGTYRYKGWVVLFRERLDWRTMSDRRSLANLWTIAAQHNHLVGDQRIIVEPVEAEPDQLALDLSGAA